MLSLTPILQFYGNHFVGVAVIIQMRVIKKYVTRSNQKRVDSVTSDTFFSTSLSCDLLAAHRWSRWKGVEHGLCRKTLCAERVTHPLYGAFTFKQIDVCGKGEHAYTLTNGIAYWKWWQEYIIWRVANDDGLPLISHEYMSMVALGTYSNYTSFISGKGVFWRLKSHSWTQAPHHYYV